MGGALWEVDKEDRRSSWAAARHPAPPRGTLVDVFALLAPGQGAQTPGMLAPWAELPGAAERLGALEAASGLDLLAWGTTGSAEQIRDTAVAQPLLTTLAVLTAELIMDDAAPGAVCGHSVGELGALAAARVLSGEAAVRLAVLRGRAMAAACSSAPGQPSNGRPVTGMVAVLGGDEDEVLDAALREGLELATVNVAGQLVLGGPREALVAFAAAPPAKARVRSLDVAGAFHTSAMAPAAAGFSAALAELTPARPASRVIANADGAVVPDGRELLDRLVVQLTSPVRFDLCLRTLASLGVTLVVELAPGGTLSALLRRAHPDIEVVALRTPDDLPTARALVSHSRGGAAESPDFGFRVVPAPEGGVVDLLRETGAAVTEGDDVALVVGRSGTCAVATPHGGHLQEWLVSGGDPVRAGQPLAVIA